MTTVWILDVVGYDARGGNAKVFSTLEQAKAATNVKVWKDDTSEPGGVFEDMGGSLSDMWVIYPRQIDG